MTRSELIEAMARAIFEAWYNSPQAEKERQSIVTPTTWAEAVRISEDYPDKAPEMRRVVALARVEATAVLSAIEAAGLCIVPVEATEAMKNVIEQMDYESHTTTNIYRAMIESGKL